MYKSTDEGKTWTHIGLEDSEHIGRIAVDPHESQPRLRRRPRPRLRCQPRRAASIAQSTAEHTWKKVLASATLPNDVGAIDVAIDPKNPKVVYASLWGTRRPPWSVYAPSNLPGGGLYKSTDGGDTWKKLSGGLPTDDFVGKIGIAVAPSNPNRLWAVVDDLGGPVATRGPGGGGRGGGAPEAKPTGGGIYVSDDAGATWKLVNSESPSLGTRLVLRARSPSTPPTPTAPTTSTPQPISPPTSARPGSPSKGAPGGDDYHQIWVNPKDPQAHGPLQRPGHRRLASTAPSPGAPGTTSPPPRSTT